MHLTAVKLSKIFWGKHCLIALLFTLMAVLGGLFLMRPNHLPLLQHAQRIADVSTWQRWWWLSDRRVFVIEESASHSCTAFLLDTSSGKKIAFPGLSRTLSTLGSNCHYELSPDGKWMVSLPWQAAPGTHWLISASNGKIQARHSASYFGGWLPDSRGWIGGSSARRS